MFGQTYYRVTFKIFNEEVQKQVYLCGPKRPSLLQYDARGVRRIHRALYYTDRSHKTPFEKSNCPITQVQANPNALIQEFTSQHLKGEQVLLKAYANFSKSPINRLTFLSNFVKVFEIEEERNDRNGIDYLQLLRLVCSDFPREIVLYSLR